MIYHWAYIIFTTWTQLKEWKLLSALWKNLEQNELYLTHGFRHLKVPFPGTPWPSRDSIPVYCAGIAQVNTPETQENQVQTNFNDFNYKGPSLILFTVESCKIKGLWWAERTALTPIIYHWAYIIFTTWTQLKEWKLLSALWKNLEQNELYLTHGFRHLKVPFPGTPWPSRDSIPVYCAGIAQVNTPQIQENQVQTNFNDFNYKGLSLMIFTVNSPYIHHLSLSLHHFYNSVERMKDFKCIVEKTWTKWTVYLTHGFHHLKVPLPGTLCPLIASQAVHCTRGSLKWRIPQRFKKFRYRRILTTLIIRGLP